nr:hypothetical protein HAGR004_40580 [Bdellovibrio sp. HAGR004]
MTKMFLISLLLTQSAAASPKRIQSVMFDKGTPHKIYLHPGLGSVITFPCFVSDSFVGDESQAEVRPSPSTRKNLLLSLKSHASKATNLIVRCEGQQSHFVLDVVPSSTSHQDILEIRAAFGRPELIEIENLKAPARSEMLPKKVVIAAPELIGESPREAK